MYDPNQATNRDETHKVPRADAAVQATASVTRFGVASREGRRSGYRVSQGNPQKTQHADQAYETRTH